MPIDFMCPHCQKQHRVGNEYASSKAKCACGQILLVPAAQELCRRSASPESDATACDSEAACHIDETTAAALLTSYKRLKIHVRIMLAVMCVAATIALLGIRVHPALAALFLATYSMFAVGFALNIGRIERAMGFSWGNVALECTTLLALACIPPLNLIGIFLAHVVARRTERVLGEWGKECCTRSRPWGEWRFRISLLLLFAMCMLFFSWLGN